MRRIVVALVAALLMTSLVACGSKTPAGANGQPASASNCPTTNQETLNKTRLLADIGITYVAFDHFIYKPFKADHLAKTSEKLKAAAAAGVIYLLVKKINNHVLASPMLCSKLAAPVAALVDKFKGLPGQLKGALTGGAGNPVDAVKGDITGLAPLVTSQLGNVDTSKLNINSLGDLTKLVNQG